jgi:hypothetical protein
VTSIDAAGAASFASTFGSAAAMTFPFWLIKIYKRYTTAQDKKPPLYKNKVYNKNVISIYKATYFLIPRTGSALLR